VRRGGPRPALGAAIAVSLVLACLALAAGNPARAQGERVASTLHNLSASGPGEIRALDETEICKFCHIPHNAVEPVPLWGHTLSRAEYRVPPVSAADGTRRPGGQPDGSSRLCLSCHDGTVALGDIGGQPRSTRMAGAQRLTRDRSSYLGTDLSGSHPISFVVPDGHAPAMDGERDIGLKPRAAIQADGDVRLDAEGKMQCTSCHDPHADRYYQPGRVPRFWVKPTVQEVCLTCHELR